MPEAIVDSGSTTVSPTTTPTASTAPILRFVGVNADHLITELQRKIAGKHITAISVGQKHALALTDEGHIISAGSDGYWKQISRLISLAAGKRITAVAAGSYHSLALTDDGHVIGAGDDYDGCITGLISQVAGKRITAIAVGRYASLALTDDGQVISAGDGPFEDASGLVKATKGKRITAISDYCWYHSLALTDDGQVIGGGFDDFHQISQLVDRTKDKRVTAIAAGDRHSLALTDEGHVIGAGNDNEAQISGLIRRAEGKRITAIAAGDSHSLALTADGQVIAAGITRYTRFTELQDKTKGRKVIAIAADYDTSLALVVQPPRVMTGQAAVAGLPQTGTSNDLGACNLHRSASSASQRSTITSDSVNQGDNQSVQVSHGESNISTTLKDGVRTVHGTVTAATAQAGTHAPLVAALSAMSLDVTVTSTHEDTPVPTVHLTFQELTINGQQQPASPAPNTTVHLDNGAKAILNRQQPTDTGIDVTAVALFDHNGHEVMRLGHISAHLPETTT